MVNENPHLLQIGLPATGYQGKRRIGKYHPIDDDQKQTPNWSNSIQQTRSSVQVLSIYLIRNQIHICANSTSYQSHKKIMLIFHLK